ncbi:hypothetical protein [Vreelandella lionensis]|uniref:hypothetical protein n=1 Tax=Vreelandella lionensis TaxID=1144478 RepID=UPI0009F31585|nr:hypothetical protein [Halomonas lionensis]
MNKLGFSTALRIGTTFLELDEQHPEATLKELHRISTEVPFRRRMGLRMAQRSTSIKHPDWVHEDDMRMLGPKGRTSLPILGKY